MNINARQSRKLIEKFNFPGEKVGEISTCISDAFFDTSTENEVTNIRLKMAHILSDGEAVMRPVPIDKHLTEINQWMKNQQPVIVGSEPGLSIDPSSADLIILLQPTRIVGRKRISRDLDLIGALFQKSALRDEFAQNANRQLILHITGPTPKEHQKDLEQVLFAYKKRICTLPAFLATRIFLAFSVGWGSHPASFAKNSFTPLTIENIYRMADVVVFPSKTEGRGLPIIEAGASGIPIICARYRPQAVFSDVIGESLPEKSRIQYTLFPKGEFSQPFLSIVSNLLICSGFQQKLNSQNRDAVHTRYSYEAFKINFARLLNQLFILAQGA
jgi:glycosyltransferase involved in cell wall biosynthesis